MAGPLQQATEDLFNAFERKDTDAIVQSVAKDSQGIDEISRRWMRGKDEFADYILQTLNVVGDVRTHLENVNELVRGDFGLLTCWIEQDYTYKGVPTHVSAPTTIVYERDGGAWKILLFHSLPLSPEN